MFVKGILLSDVLTRAGIDRSRFYRLKYLFSEVFPEPCGRLGQNSLWDESVVATIKTMDSEIPKQPGPRPGSRWKVGRKGRKANG